MVIWFFLLFVFLIAFSPFNRHHTVRPPRWDGDPPVALQHTKQIRGKGLAINRIRQRALVYYKHRFQLIQGAVKHQPGALAPAVAVVRILGNNTLAQGRFKINAGGYPNQDSQSILKVYGQ